MLQKAVGDYAHAKPFRASRITMVDGNTYDVRFREAFVMSPTSMHLGLLPSAEPTETFVEFTATHKKHVIIMREIGSSETLRNLWKHEVDLSIRDHLDLTENAPVLHPIVTEPGALFGSDTPFGITDETPSLDKFMVMLTMPSVMVWCGPSRSSARGCWPPSSGSPPRLRSRWRCSLRLSCRTTRRSRP